MPSFALNQSDYGYAGGCYECCNEAAMMEEIYFNGPIVAAIDCPPRLFQYKDGIFDDADYHHSRHCDDPHKELNGWEFTNHAVVIVGWGEEEAVLNNQKQPVKFWIIRNSWGPNWGKR